jgi:hypothetical protein
LTIALGREAWGVDSHPSHIREDIMATFRIKPADSVFNDLPQHGIEPNAFGSDSAGADTLIVDPNAFLISLFGNGAFLAPTGAWTVNVNGSVVSQSDAGIRLEAGNTAVSTIKIGVDGEVQGGLYGILVESSANIINAGEISGGVGILLGGSVAHTITNSGTITGFGSATILDSTGLSNDTVRNSGTITGAIVLSGGNDTVSNSGVTGAIILSGGNDTVSNSGDTALVALGDGTNRLTNSGDIFGEVHTGTGADTVTNTGHIALNVFLGDGTNRLTNSGTLNSVVGGNGSDTVTNLTIVGDVMKSGTITGGIFLGAGNDTFIGGANAETVPDSDGADTYKFGGGNDTYIATGSIAADGNDIVRGGAGIDTYDASAATTSDVQINLDTVTHGLLPPNTATGTNISGSAKDTIFGCENANGGDGNDFIFGSAAGNVLNGGDGNDFLFGFGGNDTLNGGTGNDLLVGGAGKDQLTGSLGADTFHYEALSDSGITAGTRDLVADFEPGIDKINFALIDANKTTPGEDIFNFIGTNTPFTGSAGQLHAFWSAIGQIIEGDVNGDKKADFSIEIADPTHAITLTSASFNL